MDRQIERQTDWKTERLNHREIERQRDWYSEILKDRELKYRYIYRQREKRK